MLAHRVEEAVPMAPHGFAWAGNLGSRYLGSRAMLALQALGFQATAPLSIPGCSRSLAVLIPFWFVTV